MPARQSTSNVPVDHLGHSFESPDPQPTLRRSTQQRFKSEYFRWLREGEGTTDRWTGDTQTCETAKTALTDVFEGRPGTEAPPDDDDVVYAMAASVGRAEGLDPLTIKEARA